MGLVRPLFESYPTLTKANELERLLPWAWKAERLAAAVHA